MVRRPCSQSRLEIAALGLVVTGGCQQRPGMFTMEGGWTLGTDWKWRAQSWFGAGRALIWPENQERGVGAMYMLGARGLLRGEDAGTWFLGQVGGHSENWRAPSSSIWMEHGVTQGHCESKIGSGARRCTVHLSSRRRSLCSGSWRGELSERPLRRQVMIWIVLSVSPSGHSESSKQNDFCLLSISIKQKTCLIARFHFTGGGWIESRGDTCGYHWPAAVTLLSAVSPFPWGIGAWALSGCS